MELPVVLSDLSRWRVEAKSNANLAIVHLDGKEVPRHLLSNESIREAWQFLCSLLNGGKLAVTLTDGRRIEGLLKAVDSDATFILDNATQQFPLICHKFEGTDTSSSSSLQRLANLSMANSSTPVMHSKSIYPTEPIMLGLVSISMNLVADLRLLMSLPSKTKFA